MGDALQRSKEMYANIIDRMKKEHHNAVDRLMELKDIELKAVLSATGRVKEVEYVLGQLEANTTDISQITNAVNKKHDSALELVKKSLEFKEKQLKDMETNLGTVRAESESERNRLTILVNRLESSLSNQGTEIESQKWLMAQEKMKLDVERTSLMEEKRHFQLTMENERRELARSKESIMREQKEMMQTIAKQKSHIYDIQSRKPKNFVTPSAEMEVFQLREERRILEEKIFSLRTEQEEIIEEERIFEEKRLKLEEEYSKNATMKEVIEQKSLDLEVKSRDLERKEEKLEESRKTLQKKLSEITQATQNLHLQQDALSKERARLELEEEDAFKRMNKGLCLSCSSKLRTNASVLYLPFGRIPGDGSEMHIGKPFDETRSKKSFDPASVLSRLKVAREEENKLRERKHQLQASSGLKPS